MKTITLSLFILLFSANAALAQTGSGWDWASVSTVATYAPGRQVLDIAIATDGSVYATGRFQGSMTLGSQTIATNGDGSVNFNFDEDAFIVKYNGAGEAQWIRKFGISAIGSNQKGQAIAVDGAGNAYVGGSGMSGSMANSSFLAKYDVNGSLIWSRTNLPLYEINGINIGPDGNLIVMESNQGTKNIYKIDNADGVTLWTVANLNAGSNGATTYQDFVDEAGNVYYTCFTAGASAATIAGQSINTAGLTSFIASLDYEGNTRWVKQVNNIQIQLGFTIDKSNGRSYIQFSGGFGDTFEGISTASFGGSRYFELDSNGSVARNLTASPYKGAFRVKGNDIYGFTTEQSGVNATLAYGSYNFYITTTNTFALGIIIRYDKATDAVQWANALKISGSAWDSGKILTMEPGTGKVAVGGLYGTSIEFGGQTLSMLSATGSSPSDLYIAQSSVTGLGIEEQKAIQYSVYPNPALNVLNIESDNDINAIGIYSPAGQEVLRQRSGNIRSVDVSGLPAGIYFIKMASDKGNKTVKFIKK